MKSFFITAVFALLLFPSFLFAQSGSNIFDKKGHVAEVEAGYIYKGGYVEGAYGYSFGNGLMLNGGIGARYWGISVSGKKSGLMIPTFLQVRYAFLNSSFKPYVGLKGGILTNYTDFGAGRFVTPQIGFVFNRFALNVGYEWMMCGYGYDSPVTKIVDSNNNVTYESSSSAFEVGRNSLTVGLSFFF